jgi:hypothetical protein
MCKSSVVAYMKPSSSCKVVLILGIGYSFLTICLLSSLKSDIVRTVLSFFGMIKEDKAHLDDGCHFNTPIDTRQSNFLHKGSLMYLWDRVWPAMVQLGTFF